MKRFFTIAKNGSVLIDKTPNIKKHWYNHPVPENALKSKITGELARSGEVG